MIKIREATLLDLLALSELGSLYSQEAKNHQHFPYDSEAAMMNAAITLQSENGTILVAVQDKELIGFLWGFCTPLPWSKAKLATDNIFYVKPEKRKSRAGYLLLSHWEEWAKAQGAVSVQISIASDINEESTLSFYKKMGYSYIGQQLRKEV